LSTSEPSSILLRHPAHTIALGFGAGLSPVAPGTAGTLWAWASFWVIDFFVVPWVWALLLPLGLAIGIWACHRTGQLIGADHGAMVWDEIVAFWLVLAVLPRSFEMEVSHYTDGWSSFALQFLAFALFRFFDAVKPPPVDWVDREFKGGLGVMADDLVAAALTLLTIAVLLRLVAFVFGSLS